MVYFRKKQEVFYHNLAVCNPNDIYVFMTIWINTIIFPV